jgi:hypothetical protein
MELGGNKPVHSDLFWPPQRANPHTTIDTSRLGPGYMAKPRPSSSKRL